MDISTQEILTELQRGLRVFKAFEHAEAVIQRVAGMEQNERELTDRLSKLRSDVAQAEIDLAAATDRAGEVVEKAAKDAEGMKMQADIDASTMRVKARKDADEIVFEAKVKAEEFERKCAEAEVTLSNFEKQIRTSASELESIERRLAAARAERDRLLNA